MCKPSEPRNDTQARESHKYYRVALETRPNQFHWVLRDDLQREEPQCCLERMKPLSRYMHARCLCA